MRNQLIPNQLMLNQLIPNQLIPNQLIPSRRILVSRLTVGVFHLAKHNRVPPPNKHSDIQTNTQCYPDTVLPRLEKLTVQSLTRKKGHLAEAEVEVVDAREGHDDTRQVFIGQGQAV